MNTQSTEALISCEPGLAVWKARSRRPSGRRTHVHLESSFSPRDERGILAFITVECTSLGGVFIKNAKALKNFIDELPWEQCSFTTLSRKLQDFFRSKSAVVMCGEPLLGMRRVRGGRSSFF